MSFHDTNNEIPKITITVLELIKETPDWKETKVREYE